MVSSPGGYDPAMTANPAEPLIDPDHPGPSPHPTEDPGQPAHDPHGDPVPPPKP